VHVDIVGPLPVDRGMRYLVTFIDRATRWPHAVAVSEVSTSVVAQALMEWVAEFGVPLKLTSDRGPQFTSALWSNLAAQLGLTIKKTTAYHPQANGLVERLHRTLKAALRSRLDGKLDWFRHVPWVLLALRVSPHEALGGLSPAQMVYGQQLAVPGALAAPQPRQPPRADV